MREREVKNLGAEEALLESAAESSGDDEDGTTERFLEAVYELGRVMAFTLERRRVAMEEFARGILAGVQEARGIRETERLEIRPEILPNGRLDPSLPSKHPVAAEVKF